MSTEEGTLYQVFEHREGTLVEYATDNTSTVSYHTGGEEDELFCLWMNDPGEPVILEPAEARALIRVLNGWLDSGRWEREE